jgi:hypothetical protein
MRLFLQFILDHRYKELVQAELDMLGMSFAIISLETEDLALAPDVKYNVMKRAMEKYEQEMSLTKQTLLVSKLKRIVAETVQQHVQGPPYIKYSVFLCEKLGHSYSYLSTLFSQAQCSTLEHYIIAQRIEVVKQL